MTNIKIFENEEFKEIRTMLINGEPWFVGKDIAENLGYRDTADALKRHVEKEDKLTRCFTDSGQSRGMYIINESGLYSLILSSKLPTAKKFKRWVTGEVLPSIRKQGLYMTEQKVKDILADPDSIIEIANRWKKAEARLALAQTKIEEDKPKVLFADTVSASSKSCLMGELAKLISQEARRQGKRDKLIGQNNLFKWMRNNGYLCKGGERRNQPKQVFIEQGLFEIKKSSYIDSNGVNVTTTTTKVTGKGQVYFVNKFLS